jgi:putative hydrolase of the HAD superfamily
VNEHQPQDPADGERIFLPWEKIDSVLLDMDGTLLDKYFDDYFWEELLPERFAALRRMPLPAAKKELYAFYKAEERTLNWTDINYWSTRLGIDLIALKEEICSMVRVHPGVETFLRFLQGQKKQIVLATNAHPRTVQIKLKQTTLVPYFDTILCSSDIGMPKEDIGFWRGAERVLLFDKARTLFVDDNQEVLAAADAFGIRYLLFKANASSRVLQKESTTFPSLKNFEALIPIEDQG